MVERRVCTFCGHEIEPGTGRMYVRRDGVVYQFCTSKCFKNMIELKRVPRRTTWTTWHAREKQTRMKASEPEPAPKKVRKVKKGHEDEPVIEGAQDEEAPGPEAEDDGGEDG